jgi:hypothetical protein
MHADHPCFLLSLVVLAVCFSCFFSFDSFSPPPPISFPTDAAAEDVGAMGDRANLLQFRPKLGDKLLCTCPMVCLVNSSRGMGPNTVPQAVPLETSLLQYSVQCHISQAFVDLLLVCQFPPVSPGV